MNTKFQFTEYHHRSGYASNENVPVLAAAAICLARAALFTNVKWERNQGPNLFRMVKTTIFFMNDPYQCYVEFCERVMIARQNLLRSKQASLALQPMEWLAQDGGFDKTKTAHERLQAKRESDQLYKLEWKALAEAILEMHERQPRLLSRIISAYWQEWFAANGVMEELRLFREAISNKSTIIKL